jgi:hypothetical protein
MDTITTFLEELKAAQSYEQDRKTGFEQIASLPVSLLSTASHDKALQAMEWSIERLRLIVIVIEALQKLSSHGYPNRVDQITSQEIISEIKKAQELMMLAIAELELPPVGTSSIEVVEI